MHVVRRLSLLVSALTLGVAVLLGVVSSRPTVSANAARSLATATHYFDSTAVLARAARPRGIRGDELAIAFGYLERLRLGLGSPFRLVDEALVDPRLDHTFQNRVAWALLGRLRRGDAYVVDPSSFEGLGPWTPGGHGATGAAHVAFIERAVRSASDPRAGELAVRLAYSIESAKGAISSSAVESRRKPRRSSATARSPRRTSAICSATRMKLHEGVMQLVVDRRASRVLRVEQPPLAPLSAVASDRGNRCGSVARRRARHARSDRDARVGWCAEQFAQRVFRVATAGARRGASDARAGRCHAEHARATTWCARRTTKHSPRATR